MEQTCTAISVTIDGNFGGDRPSDSYFETERFPLACGIQQFPGQCYRTSSMKFEILQIEAAAVQLRYAGRVYTLTPDAPVVIEKSERQTSYDGPWFMAEETITFAWEQPNSKE